MTSAPASAPQLSDQAELARIPLDGWRALIFDVDGALAETEEAHRAAFNRAFAEAGLGWVWDRETYARLLKTTGGKERIAAFQRGRADALGAEAVAALHRRKTAIYGESLATGALTLRPGVQTLIDRARAAGLRLAVATTTSRANVEALARCCWGAEASAVFDVVAAGDEVAAKKPAPDVFILALERLGLPPAQALAIEDSMNGARSAQGAGLAVLVTPSAYSAEEFPGRDARSCFRWG